jgi:hypothetical protein
MIPCFDAMWKGTENDWVLIFFIGFEVVVNLDVGFMSAPV